MKRLLLLNCCLLLTIVTIANTIIVKNIDELNTANKKAQPGDVIILQNGEWKDVNIKLNCTGTIAQPVTFKAETAGKVVITGKSQLKIGGTYIIVDGLYFTNGYSGNDPVINFRTDSKQLANNCRVTNTSINDFNNPKRMDENYWVCFYGKNNRLDHCSFKEKKNMGVLLAVILDDDRSRENFHSIDHNYFGHRPPLASNSGEIMRVGVSQHCEFNSNTQITDNFFENCDGETEIVSIKSCSNVVRGNVFKECQGGVVLRHGNYNTVENNIFLGNGKEGTGGVRIINKGQWVVNNFFYKCRGIDFRSPLSVMNGIPNSPANRYVQVTDAVVANNTFMECSAISLCEGSDAERTLPPENVLLVNNIFYNTKDDIIYRAFDDTKGIRFASNEINSSFKIKTKGNIDDAFIRRLQTLLKSGANILPVTQAKTTTKMPDSLKTISQMRLGHSLAGKPGFTDVVLLRRLEAAANGTTGATWFKPLNLTKPDKAIVVNCATAKEVYDQLERKEPVVIYLTGNKYSLEKPFTITKQVQFITNSKAEIAIKTDKKIMGVFVIAGNGNLSLKNLIINGNDVEALHFISNEDGGSSNHYNLNMSNCTVSNLSKKNNCEDIFYAYKSMVADSIVFRNNIFINNKTNGIVMADEKEDKGYYSAEKIIITNNNFTSQTGTLLNVYRGGSDESTMGPNLLFSNNKLQDCKNNDKDPLIKFTGVQVTKLVSNSFFECNADATLVFYTDKVRARHSFEKNVLYHSGTLEKDQFVTEKENIIK